ncbi:hypothetical protein QUF80_15770 [Desulfococcaceae bacterium HSG8]|nr:hypothetical protein [Desulfococcaceae bacterium HSG8]
MDTKEAITAFSQSDKIKSGLIWISHSIEMINSLSPPEQKGAEQIIRMFVQMLDQEIVIARRFSSDMPWDEVIKHIDKARIMLHSGVPAEATFHLTRALSRVTDIGQRSMSFLKDEGLL